MRIYKNGVEVDSYTSEYGNRKIVIAIDSSKSNTAMSVWDSTGVFLDDYEISGAGGDVEIYQHCWNMRTVLKELFKNADIIDVGLEDIITKNEKGYKGLQIHQSRAKITAVFDSLICFFQDSFGLMPQLVNNQAWKSAVLPEEYRKRDHKKGSLDWFNNLGNRWAGRSDDVTDCVCIGMYMFKKKTYRPTYEIREILPCRFKYKVKLFPIEVPVPNSFKEFKIYNNETLEHNTDTIACRLEAGETGYVVVPIESVPIDWLFSDRLIYNNVYSYRRNLKSICVTVTLED